MSNFISISCQFAFVNRKMKNFLFFFKRSALCRAVRKNLIKSSTSVKAKHLTGRDFMRKIELSANTFYRRVREYEETHGITKPISA